MTDGSLERLPRTRQAIEAGILQGHHLGAQLYVSLQGEVAADAALGENRPGEPPTRDHLMLWLSSTKPVTAVAIAQLWERGLLELDDPVALHLPEFAANGKGGITLRHLLTHTGGIRMLDTGWPQSSWLSTARRARRPMRSGSGPCSTRSIKTWSWRRRTVISAPSGTLHLPRAPGPKPAPARATTARPDGRSRAGCGYPAGRSCGLERGRSAGSVR